MKDEMSIRDGEIQLSVKCAICGEIVQPGEVHQHKEEKKDANSK